MGDTTSVEEGDGRRPDHALGAEVGLVGGVVEEETQRDELLVDEGGYLGVRIRHGIQGDAARSALFAEVGQDEGPLAGGALRGRVEVGFPGKLCHATPHYEPYG